MVKLPSSAQLKMLAYHPIPKAVSFCLQAKHAIEHGMKEIPIFLIKKRQEYDLLIKQGNFRQFLA